MRLRAALMATGLLWASPAAAMTFQEALAAAYNANPDLLGARATQRATDEQVPEARAGWLPTISMTGSVGQNNTQVYRPGYSTHSGAAAGGLEVKQPIFDGGRTPSSVAQAENTVLAGRADLLGTEQSVLLKAATAYQDVWRDRALLALAREKENVLREQWRDIGIRFRSGELTQTDVDQANSRYIGARSSTATQLGQLQTSEAEFQAAVGQPPGPLAPAPRLPGLPQTVEAARNLADVNSPVVIASAFRERAARANIGVARADLLPNLSATLDADRDYGQSIPRARAQAFSGTLNLTIPLYQGGANYARLRAAKQTAERSRLDTLVSRRDAIQNAASAFASWTTDAQAAQFSEQQVGIAQAALDGVQRQAALGARSTFELLGQLQELYDARATRINLQHDAAVASYQLLVATGRFTADDLRLQVQRYDPLVHYQKARGSFP